MEFNMEQVTKNVKTQNTTVTNNTAKNVVEVIWGIIEVLLAFRLVFKVLGAAKSNFFVKVIYGLTDFMVFAFKGIFSGLSEKAGQAIAAVVAMLVVALIAFVVIKLIKPKTGVSVENAEHTEKNAVDE